MTITHPSHPLRGQSVEIIRVRRGIDPDLVVRLPDGHHAAIAMSSTDYAAPGKRTALGASTHLLDFYGLRQAAQLIETILQQNQRAASTTSQE